MRKVKFGLAFPPDMPRRELDAEFTDEEWAALDAHCGYARDLDRTAFVKAGKGTNLNLRYDVEAGLSFTVDMPPWEHVIGLLHCLRPLILEKEFGSFVKVRAILKRRLQDEAARAFLDALLDRYTGKHMQSMIQMFSNNELMNSERMLFVWLNAHEYHRDVDKREFLETLHQILPLEWSRGVFVTLLVDKVQAIFTLSLLIDVLQGRRSELNLHL